MGELLGIARFRFREGQREDLRLSKLANEIVEAKGEPSPRASSESGWERRAGRLHTVPFQLVAARRRSASLLD
jgi:hypothetical protein